MRILFYLYRYPAIGGIEGVTTILANAFADIGDEIGIVSHVAVDEQCNSQKLKYGITVGHMPSSAYYSWNNRRYLQKHICNFAPDVIIFQDSYAPVERNLFPVESNIPVVVCEHNSPYVFYEEPNQSGNTIRVAIERFAFPLVKQLKYLRDRVRRRYLYSHCWRYVLLSERFYGEFKAVSRIGDARKLMAIPNVATRAEDVDFAMKEDEILFVGAVNKRKGVDVLVDVWCSIHEKHPSWRLTIVGDGPLRAELEQSVMTRQIPRISFEGAKDDPKGYFKRAKIFAFPTRREGWSLVITEALAHKCVPVVYDSFSSVRDNIVDGENGILVPPFDSEMFSSKLDYLMADFEGLNKMANKAASMLGRYSRNVVLSKWKDLLVLK